MAEFASPHVDSNSESEYGYNRACILALAGLIAGLVTLWVSLPELPAPGANVSPRLDPVAVQLDSPPSPPKDKTKFRTQASLRKPDPRTKPASLAALSGRPHRHSLHWPAGAERRPDKNRSPQKPVVKSPAVAALAKDAPAASAAVPSSLPQRLNGLTEDELRSDLERHAAIVGLNNELAAEHVKSLHQPRSRSPEPAHSIELELTPALMARTGVTGLPFQMGNDCQLDKTAARALETHSRELHQTKARFAPRSPMSQMDSLSSSAWIHQQQRFLNELKRGREWRTVEAVPAMVQVLQAESFPIRLQLVKTLTVIQSQSATRALAGRALFDLSAEIRDAANEALKQRLKSDYRTQLLEGLRYPWPPVAQHAAESLVAVDDQRAVAPLIALLDLPDPARPYRNDAGQTMVRELVRINHLRNCLLCHASSRGENDLVAALVPTPGEPIQPVYYGSRRRSLDTFVRADVTYLRQDFSVVHELPNEKPWPSSQRFDYLVRERELRKQEVLALSRQPATAVPAAYPQRQAVLHALRELTGQHVGTTSEAWRLETP